MVINICPTISTMIKYYKQILPNQIDLYKFDKATNTKWKDGTSSTTSTKLLTSNSGGNVSGGFGLFDMTKNIQGGSGGIINSDAMKQFSRSTGTINNNNNMNKPLIMKKDEINKIKLKQTHSNKSPKNIAPQSSQSNNVDFRAVLKKTSQDNKDNYNHSSNNSYHSHTMDFRAQMKQKKKPKINQNNSDIKLQEQEEEEQDIKPKLPPPNPIEVMSKEQRERQKENTHILEIFQDFENNMAQYDEEIDFKQSFAESIVSQIMGLAENNNVISANKYKTQIDAKCKLVVNAAKKHSEALQKFNHMLQQIYSQMEDELEQQMPNNNNNKGGISGLNTPMNTNNTFNTPGGPSEGYGDEYNDNNNGGLPLRNPTVNFSMDNLEIDDSKTSLHQTQYSNEQLSEALSGGLPRYQSATDIAKSNEPEKKVAKALYDYPGGYRSNELTFHRGTSLIITKEKEGWV
eukprot:208792_1